MLGASRRAEQLPGKELVADLKSADGNLTVSWHAVLRDGLRYLRQEFTFTAGKNEVPLNSILLMEMNLPGAHATGKVDDSPIRSRIKPWMWRNWRRAWKQASSSSRFKCWSSKPCRTNSKLQTSLN